MKRESSAFSQSFPYWHLLWEMTRAEAKLRDQGTVLGFLWTLLHPALMFVVLYALFIKWLGRFVEGYAAYLLMGLVIWNFFQKATSCALGSLRRNRDLVLNYRFPREIIVLSSVGAVFWSSLLEFCVLLAFLPALGQRPAWTWLFLPVLILALLLLVVGPSLILALVEVEYQDMERIWEVLSTCLFYLTPVFYPLSIISEGRRSLLLLSPLTQLLAAFRACVLETRPPEAPMIAGLFLLGSLGTVAGFWAVRRWENRIADKLLV